MPLTAKHVHIGMTAEMLRRKVEPLIPADKRDEWNAAYFPIVMAADVARREKLELALHFALVGGAGNEIVALLRSEIGRCRESEAKYIAEGAPEFFEPSC